MSIPGFHGSEFAHPWLLLLAIVLLLLASWRWRLVPRTALRLPTMAAVDGLPKTLRLRLRWLPTAGRIVALLLLAAALARPRGGEVIEQVTAEGVDIAIALDTSGSMLAEDMTSADGSAQNRIGAAKDVVAWFVKQRQSDRIGLVTFDDASVPRCPPTLDYDVLLGFLDQVTVSEDSRGTAIGAGLASALSRLKDSKARSRLVILVTDGRNNAGRIEPADAAAIAKLLGVRIYAVGVGTRGLARYPVGQGLFGRTEYQMVRADVDDDTLRSLADATGGLYYRATDRDELAKIFAAIDALEKSQVDVKRHVRYHEHFAPLLRIAALALVGAVLVGATFWRRFP